MTEADGANLLKDIFGAAGYQITERFTFDEGGVFAEFDGWDPIARVGYEYVTSESGDHLEFTPAAITELERRMKKGELYVLLVDEHDAEGADALSDAAAKFLAEVAARRVAA